MRSLLSMSIDRPFRLPTGTVTFLLTDIEGSSTRWDRDPATMSSAVTRHYEILDDAIARAGGVRPVEQGEGDSIVGAFSRATDALLAALDAQQTLIDELGDIFRVRMAVHTGEAQLRDEGNYFGQTVIRCARLRALGHGGQILVSRTSVDLCADGLPAGVTVVDLGEVRLRDLGRRERVFQLAHDGLPQQFPPLRSLENIPTNLPTPMTTLVGREDELLDVADLLLSHRLVTLAGVGGAGKTRLAMQVGADVIDRFPDGVWWVELASVAHGQDVVATVLRACGIPQVAGSTPTETMVMHMSDRNALLVLDNCEHVLADASTAASMLLSECAGLRIVATSREPLSVAGELIWRVPPLALPPMCHTYAVDSLAAYDAVRLFIDRAQLVRPSFEVTASNAPAVAEICQRLDGIPLAIELAAARVRQLPVERIVSAIDDRFRLLTGGVRASLPRQQTLRASIEWSYDLLDDAERSVLVCLGVFVGGFDIDAVEQIVAKVEPALDPYLVFDVLARLIDKSLIASDDAGRYQMLESIRSFAIERAVQYGLLGALRDAHLAWTLSLVETWALHRAFPSTSVEAELSAELANLSTALEWSIGKQTLSPAIGLLRPLTRRWYEITSFDEAASWARRLFAATEDELARRQIAAEFAEIAAFSENVELVGAAIDAFRSALESGDDRVLARAARAFGLAANFGDPDAFAYLERGRDAAHDAQDPFGEFELSLMLAVGHRSCNRNEAMRAELERADLIATWPHPMMTMHRAMQCASYCFGGAYDEALRLALAEPEGVTAAHAYMVPFGVVAAIAVGDERSLDAIASRVQRMPRSGVPGSMGALSTLAVSLARDDIDAATAQLRAMLQQPPVLGASGLMALLVWGALVADATGDPSLRAEFANLIPARRSDAPIPERFGATFARAHTALEPDTWNALHEALAIASDGNLVLFLPVALGAVTELHFAEGRVTVGLALLAAIEHDLTMRHGLPISPGHRRRQLAAAEGHGPLPQPALSLQDAAALALRSRGDRQRPSTGWGSLTPTERQVTTLAAAGLSNLEIAEQLIMSTNTVKTHLSHIFTKLGLRNRAELAALATKLDPNRKD